MSGPVLRLGLWIEDAEADDPTGPESASRMLLESMVANVHDGGWEDDGRHLTLSISGRLKPVADLLVHIASETKTMITVALDAPEGWDEVAVVTPFADALDLDRLVADSSIAVDDAGYEASRLPFGVEGPAEVGHQLEQAIERFERDVESSVEHQGRLAATKKFVLEMNRIGGYGSVNGLLFDSASREAAVEFVVETLRQHGPVEVDPTEEWREW